MAFGIIRPTKQPKAIVQQHVGDVDDLGIEKNKPTGEHLLSFFSMIHFLFSRTCFTFKTITKTLYTLIYTLSDKVMLTESKERKGEDDIYSRLNIFT